MTPTSFTLEYKVAGEGPGRVLHIRYSNLQVLSASVPSPAGAALDFSAAVAALREAYKKAQAPFTEPDISEAVAPEVTRYSALSTPTAL